MSRAGYHRKFRKRTLVFAAAFLVLAAGVLGVFATPWGAGMVLRAGSGLGLHTWDITWASLEGSLVGGVTLRDLEMKGTPFLPAGNMLRAQGVRVKVALFPSYALSLDNARFYPGVGDEPIVVNGSINSGVLAVSVFTRRLDLEDVREVLSRFLDVPAMSGMLTNVDLKVDGLWNAPHVQGTCIARRVTRSKLVLENAPVAANLDLRQASPAWETRGKLLIASGKISGGRVKVDVGICHLGFNGQVKNPEVEFAGKAVVQRVRVDIAVHGTREEPRVDLSSDPYLSKEQIMLLLVTGKKWPAFEETITARGRNPQLTSDFVDFLLFGGEGGWIARRLGLSAISLKADGKKEGLSFSKDVSERLAVGYGVERPVTEVGAPRPLTQKFEGDYQMTDKVSVSVQKELKPEPTKGRELELQDIPDDRFLLKYKTNF